MWMKNEAKTEPNLSAMEQIRQNQSESNVETVWHLKDAITESVSQK